jgi:lauroyl/myristoyl acyltransferase/SAM-dependent methyltransferase
MGAPEQTAEPRAYRSFWSQVGRDFPSLKGAASTDYYFDGERLLFEQFFPRLAGRTVFKTDLWDEAKGTEILRWAAEQGARPVGIDIARATVAGARSLLAPYHPAFALADLRWLPLRSESVDLVYSMGTIEHFEDYETAVAEIYRVLKPGGRAIVGVPNKLDPFLRPALVQALRLFGAYPYGLEKSFTSAELRRLLEAAGFQAKALSGVLFIPGWLRMIDLALHARGSRFERATRWLVRPFESLFRRFPAVRRHGYLIAWAVEKPRAGAPAPGRRPEPRWASLRDIVGVAQMSMGWLVTAVLPERLIPAVGRGLGEVAAAFARRATRRGAEEMRRRLGPQLDEGESRALFVEHVKRKYEHLLGRARDTHRRGWHPEVELCGAEHLRRALAAGRGAVLWVTACCGPLVPKIALARGGFRITHLSMPLHGGFSHSRLALRVLNPWTRRSEDKHLAGRVVMRLDGTIAHLMRLREILLANGCVSIAGEHRGRRNVTVPVLGEEQAFASGACSLARSTGAALLMVQSHRVAPGAYRVVIEPVATDQGLSPLAREKAVIGDLAARLEAWVRAHPADWERWSTIDPAID